MNKEQELRSKITELRDELHEIEDARKLGEFAAIEGYCYVYQNSYGAGSRWPLYQKVVKKDGDWCVIKAQVTDRGEAQFICERLWNNNFDLLGDSVSDACYEQGVKDCLEAAHATVSTGHKQND